MRRRKKTLIPTPSSLTERLTRSDSSARWGSPGWWSSPCVCSSPSSSVIPSSTGCPTTSTPSLASMLKRPLFCLPSLTGVTLLKWLFFCRWEIIFLTGSTIIVLTLPEKILPKSCVSSNHVGWPSLVLDFFFFFFFVFAIGPAQKLANSTSVYKWFWIKFVYNYFASIFVLFVFDTNIYMIPN